MNSVKMTIKSRKTAFQILQVDENATTDDIKKAYRKASLIYHPDKNSHDPEANKKFILIQCAYQLLVHNRPCPELKEYRYTVKNYLPEHTYNLDNEWGYFLFWRDHFIL
jgi:preprotein translocase subunit Sec63